MKMRLLNDKNDTYFNKKVPFDMGIDDKAKCINVYPSPMNAPPIGDVVTKSLLSRVKLN